MEFRALHLALYEIKEEIIVGWQWNPVDMLVQIEFQKNRELFKRHIE